MLRVYAVLGLLIVALLNLGGAHSKHPYQTIEEDNYSWEEAEGYQECQEFSNDPGHNEFLMNSDAQDFDGSSPNDLGNNPDDQGNFRKNPKPKPLEEICGPYECPMFKKVESSGCGFEERIILRANWTVTDIDLTSPYGYREAYFRLHGYRSGAKNDRGLEMDMAVPVIKKWWMDKDGNILSATMSFYIPADVQSNPPASTDEQLRVEQWDEATIYIRAYGGDRNDPEHLKQFDLLKTALAKQNLTPYPYMRMTAGFTRPGYGRQRREVILVDNASMV